MTDQPSATETDDQRHGRFLLTAGAFSAAATVLLGAFAAHALKHQLPNHAMAIFHTGVDYQFWHALGLMVIGLIIEREICVERSWLAGRLMLAGSLIFSVSLYLLAVTGLKWLGAITPIGGILMVSAWLVLGTALARRHR